MLRAMRRVDEIESLVLDAGKILSVAVAQIPTGSIGNNYITAVTYIESFALTIFFKKFLRKFLK